jgi:dihydropyrimidinase
MRVDYSMFEGIRVKGVPRVVLSRGEVVVDRGTFTGRAGHGQFLRRQPHADV